ncbi:lipase 3-like [Uranotaenia lowii]|uniref:lipase 3-like n=1 Tax=Uranotaenia lowii TaxID=190385 RepID=UPI00247ACFDD|nr:lipase 3-like [Uranotaenia lowii]
MTSLIHLTLLLVSAGLKIVSAQEFGVDELLRSSISRFNYPVELHPVETIDGYKLMMARIPAPGKPILFCMHSFLSSSAEYTVFGPKKSLAFLASEAGFDVWLGNGRGNTFSRAHRTIDPNQRKFWSFSFHEAGVYDLPAMIDYTLNVTQKQQLHYVGHSQGSVNFLVLTSMLPQYNSRIASAHLSAPVAFWSQNTLPFRLIDDQLIEVLHLLDDAGYCEVFGRSDDEFYERLSATIKGGGSVTKNLFFQGLWMIIGKDEKGFNQSSLDSIMEFFPAGASIRQALHFTQTYKTETFSQYDFGKTENMKRYGRASPPEYPLQNIVAPVALYYGLNDPLVAVEDLELLAEELPNQMKMQNSNQPAAAAVDGTNIATCYKVISPADSFGYRPSTNASSNRIQIIHGGHLQ